MPDRLPPPGPSFVREVDVRLGDRVWRAGMSRPTTTDDGWWLAVLWLVDERGEVPAFEELAPAPGPPPDPPLRRLGPALAGSLSGMILEEDRRLSIRLAPAVPGDDPTRPWRAPAAVRAGFKWEPLRVATMRDTEVASAVLTGFARSVEGFARR